MCYAAARWAKIRKIVYDKTRQDADAIGFSDNAIYDEIIHEKQHMEACHVPLMEDEFTYWAGHAKDGDKY